MQSIGILSLERWSVMSEFSDFEYASAALRRVQARAQAQGHYRIPLRSRRRSVSGQSEEFAEEILLDDEQEASEVNLDPQADPDGELSALSTVVSRAGSRWIKMPGMAPMRRKYREPKKLGLTIDSLIASRGWQEHTRAGELMARWNAIVGDEVAEHCSIETIDDHRLIVQCDSTAWFKQLQLLLPRLERTIAEAVGEGVVQQVILRPPASPSWKKGRLSVPGRGPRDTYA